MKEIILLLGVFGASSPVLDDDKKHDRFNALVLVHEDWETYPVAIEYYN